MYQVDLEIETKYPLRLIIKNEPKIGGNADNLVVSVYFDRYEHNNNGNNAKVTLDYEILHKRRRCDGDTEAVTQTLLEKGNYSLYSLSAILIRRIFQDYEEETSTCLVFDFALAVIKRCYDKKNSKIKKIFPTLYIPNKYELKSFKSGDEKNALQAELKEATKEINRLESGQLSLEQTLEKERTKHINKVYDLESKIQELKNKKDSYSELTAIIKKKNSQIDSLHLRMGEMIVEKRELLAQIKKLKADIKKKVIDQTPHKEKIKPNFGLLEIN